MNSKTTTNLSLEDTAKLKLIANSKIPVARYVYFHTSHNDYYKVMLIEKYASRTDYLDSNNAILAAVVFSEHYPNRGVYAVEFSLLWRNTGGSCEVRSNTFVN